MNSTTSIDWCCLKLDVEYGIVPEEYGLPEIVEIYSIRINGKWFETEEIVYRGMPLEEWIAIYIQEHKGEWDE